MWIADATRRELLTLVQSQELDASLDCRQQDVCSPLPNRTAELQMIWRDDPRTYPSLPAVVILDSESCRDFLAWVATYLPGFRPFTAYCRVLTRDLAENALKRLEPPKLDGLEGACVGLVLGEVTTYVAGRPDVAQLSSNACASTYSFVMARAFAFNHTLIGQERISNAWSQARSLTRQQKLSLSIDRLDAPWSVVMQLATTDSSVTTKEVNKVPQGVFEGCRDIWQGGDIQATRWEALTERLPEVRPSREALYGPREERVKCIERTLQQLVDYKHPDDISSSFIAGYLLSRINPGTFEHYGVLLPFLGALPEAFIWYGLCAGLNQRSDLLSHSEGLGRRLIRELLRNEDVLDSPRCDIAIAELEILAGGADARMDFRKGDRGYIDVEVVPCVSSLMRWPPHGTAQEANRIAGTQAGQQTELFSAPVKGGGEIRELLGELDWSLNNLQRLRDKLLRLVQPAEQYKQRLGRKKR